MPKPAVPKRPKAMGQQGFKPQRGGARGGRGGGFGGRGGAPRGRGGFGGDRGGFGGGGAGCYGGGGGGGFIGGAGGTSETSNGLGGFSYYNPEAVVKVLDSHSEFAPKVNNVNMNY